MNDPNGVMYYNKVYHLFSQYNPDGPIWGDMHWGHLVSPDLVHWKEIQVSFGGKFRVSQIALYPDHWYDSGGVFSGSATILREGYPVLAYTGQASNLEVQCVAYPANISDPLLVMVFFAKYLSIQLDWVKPGYNPIISSPPDPNPQRNSFRDDTTAWTIPGDKHYYLGVGGSTDDV
jgi:beta-fructofuranosidase